MLLLGLYLFFIVSLALASPLQKRACQNGPTSRNCWGSFSIDDDEHTIWPNTGVTREYTFTISETTEAPDGVSRPVMLVNGQYPGPTIEANWGDFVKVTVKNELRTNGTGIHWHGVRQLNSVYADGTAAVTECPIAPGRSHSYTWQATQHGTGWYHSHYSLQYSDGVVGAIVVNGPRTANYDTDLGPVILTDWYHKTAFKIATQALQNSLGLPPIQPNALINGKNVYHGKGSWSTFNFTPGKKHLLRLINTGSEVTFRFSIDDHELQVIAMDWVPIKPYTTKSITIAVGQRYDVIVDTKGKKSQDYWMRAVPQTSCLSLNLNALNVKAIVRYNAASTSDPKTLPKTLLDACVDEDPKNLVPYHVHDVGSAEVNENADSNLLDDPEKGFALRWFVGADPYYPHKNDPSAKKVMAGQSLPDEMSPMDIGHLGVNKWVYVIVQSWLPIAHPMHLHGHDTYILRQGASVYVDGLPINTKNPPRRDTVQLPASGHVVIAFKTDNPGTWLLHCHIAFHLHHGFARTVIEQQKLISGVYGSGRRAEMNHQCDAWSRSGLESRD
ncbi:hypothetical protein EX30DRAFT_366980 [Ascodesmis nigricans]|uniref:Multicopper oxidase n=1 Tax=Ascodesmis nigricans TaxID=341454 RepID=A0A4S2MJN4_9PEZI|nr:hypothetical protein EX30DRAFT_366980 [Ascodesmis nigricans]